MTLRIIIPIIFFTICTTGMAQKKPISEIIAPYAYNTNYTTLADSIKLAYVDEGSSDTTLVFIHGLATYLPSWRKNIKFLSEKYRCIALDLPGYGRSSKALYPVSMRFYAQIVNKFLKQLDLQNVTLVGHSMGAQVSITTALEYPEVVNSLVLASPAGFETFTESEASWLKSVSTPSLFAAATAEQIRANYKLNFYSMPPEVDFMIQDRINMKEASDFDIYTHIVAGGVAAMLDGPVFSHLDQLHVPVLILFGASDALIPNQFLHKALTTKNVAESGNNQLPNSTLAIIPECGHFVPYERSDIFNQRVIEFLSDN